MKSNESLISELTFKANDQTIEKATVTFIDDDLIKIYIQKETKNNIFFGHVFRNVHKIMIQTHSKRPREKENKVKNKTKTDEKSF